MYIKPRSLRRFVWRIGRRLYMAARGEMQNEINVNGENYVQKAVMHGSKRKRDDAIVVLDVGANLGQWANSLLGVIDSDLKGKINLHLFEPVPSTFNKLKSSLKTAISPKNIHNLALSDEGGETDMVIMSDTGGTNSLDYDKNVEISAQGKVAVKKDTLDKFCEKNNISRINLLKIDTEGHDRRVISGAMGMIREERIDVIQFEYNFRWIYSRSFIKDVFDMIDGLPYQIGRICPNHIELFEGWHYEIERFFEDNFIIIHDSSIEYFHVVQGSFDEANTYA